MNRQAPPGHADNVAPSTGAGAADLDAAEFAEYLRAERERRQLTLEQIADETKIASRHLEALERGDVRNWPGGMYRRAMMRAYAESIGVDREFALKQFEQAFDAPSPNVEAPAPPIVAPSAPVRWRPSRRQLLAAGASTLTVAALAIVWNVVASFTSSGGDVPREPAAAVHSTPAAAVGSTPAAAPVRPGQLREQPRASTPAPRPAVSDAVVPAAAQRDIAATTGTGTPRPLATEGSLVVESEPAGARVTVNGVGWGETPITIRHLEFGSKRVRLTLQDYVSEERIVHFGPERSNVRVRVTLRERR